MARLSDSAVHPLKTLDPAAPLDDLDWVDDAIGDARIVAIGESAHYNGESYRLRHRLCRYLVERHGFGAYAMESGFVEGWSVDDWVRGGGAPLGEAMAHGITSLMGLWTQQRAHLEWMREHNRTTARPVRFYGIDLPGSNVSMLPGLDAVAAYLAEADPELFADLDAPEPGSLDELMAASHDGPFAVDLRRLSTADEEAVRGATTQRAGIGTFHATQSPLDAWDVVIHLPTVTAADPDDDALTYAPHDVQKAFTRWKQQA